MPAVDIVRILTLPQCVCVIERTGSGRQKAAVRFFETTFFLLGCCLRTVAPPVRASPLKHRALPSARQKTLPRARRTRTQTHTLAHGTRAPGLEGPVCACVRAMTSAVVRREGGRGGGSKRQAGCYGASEEGILLYIYINK